MEFHMIIMYYINLTIKVIDQYALLLLKLILFVESSGLNTNECSLFAMT